MVRQSCHHTRSTTMFKRINSTLDRGAISLSKLASIGEVSLELALQETLDEYLVDIKKLKSTQPQRDQALISIYK